MNQSTQNIYAFWLKRYTQYLINHRTDILHLSSTQKVHAFLRDDVGFVSAAYRNQAVSALAHHYRSELGKDIDISSLRARTNHTHPVHFTKDEFFHILRHFNPQYQLLALLLAGSIPNLHFILQLRAEHILLDKSQIYFQKISFPLPSKAIPLINIRSGWLFPGKTSHLTAQSVQWYFRQYQRTLNEPRLRPQTICNSFWVWLWQTPGVTEKTHIPFRYADTFCVSMCVGLRPQAVFLEDIPFLSGIKFIFFEMPSIS